MFLLFSSLSFPTKLRILCFPFILLPKKLSKNFKNIHFAKSSEILHSNTTFPIIFFTMESKSTKYFVTLFKSLLYRSVLPSLLILSNWFLQNSALLFLFSKVVSLTSLKVPSLNTSLHKYFSLLYSFFLGLLCCEFVDNELIYWYIVEFALVECSGILILSNFFRIALTLASSLGEEVEKFCGIFGKLCKLLIIFCVFCKYGFLIFFILQIKFLSILSNNIYK